MQNIIERFSVALIVIMLSYSCMQAAPSPIKNIIPIPVEVTEKNGQFTFNKSTAIYVDSKSMEMVRLAEYFASITATDTYKLPIRHLDQHPAAGGISFSLHPEDASLGNEGYEINVQANNISIAAQQPAGIFYAIQTFIQLLPPKAATGNASLQHVIIPACHIKDQPRFAYRGVMLDVARHFFSVDDVKRYIDLIAFYKINTLHLGLTNDQGWRIEIKSWPELTRIGGSSSVNGDRPGFYTQMQYKDIVQYAQSRFITLIPEIDMPGHTNAALASYAVLNCNDTATALYTGIKVGFSSFCIHKDITYKFVDDVIREISALTPGPYIHIGGDESHSTKKDDYIFFIEKAVAIVQAHGKKAIGWDEVATARLPANSLVQFWANKSNAKAAAAQHAQLIMSPAQKVYLDMQYDSTTKLGLHWAAYVEVDSSYGWDPASYILGVDEENIIGVEAPLWTETIRTMDDIEYMTFPRLPGIAEIAWSPKSKRNWAEYKWRLADHGAIMQAMQINFYRSPLVPWK